MTCACGREHFEDSERAGDWDEGELEKLRAQADGVKVFAHRDGVTSGLCNKIHYVFGCPCDAYKKFEAFIWDHRRQIATYLQSRSVEVKRITDFEHALLGDLEKGVVI